VSDIDTAVVDGLKALDPKRPIREADVCSAQAHGRYGPKADIAGLFDHLVGAGKQRLRHR
jgi:hypothetical protein